MFRAMWTELIRKWVPSSVYFPDLPSTQESFVFMLQLADIVESLLLYMDSTQPTAQKVPLPVITKILVLKCQRLCIEGYVNSYSLAEAEKLLGFVNRLGKKVYFEARTEIWSMEEFTIGEYNLEVAQDDDMLITRICISHLDIGQL